MAYRCGLLLLGACAVGGGLVAAGEPFVVKDGKARATIVVGEAPTRMASLAARELQTYVEKISGARLPIAAEPADAPVRIYVGRSVHTDRLGVSVEGLGHGAYRMASGADWLALVGSGREFRPVEPYAHRPTWGSRGRAERRCIDREWDKITGDQFSNPFHYVQPFWREELGVWEFDDAGVLNAVYDLLREQGVRWFYPGELGEIAPKAASIVLPAANRVVRPDFDLRKLGWWSRRLSMTPEEHLWNLRMGTDPGADIIGLTQLCHGSKFVHLREEFKQAHPDYFALFNGKRAFDHKRGQGAPCLSSEGFFGKHLKYARAVFDHYDEPMVSIDVVDGYGRGLCQCQRCKGKDTPERGYRGLMSDYVLGYVDRVARELLKSHPGKRVSALSYGAYRLPPTSIAAFPPNLALWICQKRKNDYDRQAREDSLALRKQWLGKLPSKQLFIYEYYLANRPGGAWEGVPVYFPHRIAEDLRSLKGVSRGEYIDLYQPHERDKLGYDYLAVSHLNLYVTTRLWWDADRDVDALLEEYYALFYGPARDEMKAFVEYCERNWPRMRKDVGAIDKALELVADARRAAGDGVYGKRVDLAVRYVEPMRRLRKQLVSPRVGVPEARALVRNGSALTIDGKLDEELWQTVRMYSLRELHTGRAPFHRTTFRIAWVRGALCLGITCRDMDMKHLSIGTTKPDDPNVWSGDVVEVLIETQFHAYYQIAVSPTGAVTDLDRENRLNMKWSSGAEAATCRGPDGWTLEVRLPAAGENARDIDPLSGIAGRKPSRTYPWFVNVCRQRVRGEHTELSAWSPTSQARFNVPRKFGKVYVK